MNRIELVRAYYDEIAPREWTRLEGQPEFLFTTRIMSRYIKPGDRVLDIGAGPGRYSLWLAERGCDVTLLELSGKNVEFAKAKAVELKLPVTAICGNALDADKLVDGQFDHVLNMGPLYHLLEEQERITSVAAALKLTKPSGLLWAAFLNLFSGVNWARFEAPDAIISHGEREYLDCVAENRSWAGAAFTQAFFCAPHDALKLMERFPLEKLHFFNQEGLLGEGKKMLESSHTAIMGQPKEIIDAWLDYSERLLDMPEYYALAQHLMYVGRKR